MSAREAGGGGDRLAGEGDRPWNEKATPCYTGGATGLSSTGACTCSLSPGRTDESPREEF